MNSLIHTAQAQGGAPANSGGFELLIMVAVFFLIMYFVVIRPQNKRNKSHKELIESLTVGDEVTTVGGILGRIASVGENFVDIEVHNNVKIKVQKQSVNAMMPKGTLSGE